MTKEELLPHLPLGIEPELQSVRTEFSAQLTVVGREIVVCSSWQLYGDLLTVERAGLIAKLIPGYIESLAASRGGDEDFDTDAVRRPEVAPGYVRYGAVWGSGSYGGLGAVSLWAVDSRWLMLTFEDNGESSEARWPVILGFVGFGELPSGAAKVLEETVSDSSYSPDEVSWEGFTAFDALMITTGLKLATYDLSELDKPLLAILLDSESSPVNVEALVQSYEDAKAVEELVSSFQEMVASRRTLSHVKVELPLAKRIDQLSRSDLEIFSKWLEVRGLSQGLDTQNLSVRWEQEYRRGAHQRIFYKGPAVLLPIAQEYVPFPGWNSCPSLGDLLERLPQLPSRQKGQSDLEFADFLWARDFEAEASALYKEVVERGEFLEKIAALARFLATGKPGDVISNLNEIVRASVEHRTSAAEIIIPGSRDAAFQAAFALERDAQKVLAIAHRLDGNFAAAVAAYRRWRLLVKEIGDGVDPFQSTAKEKRP